MYICSLAFWPAILDRRATSFSKEAARRTFMDWKHSTAVIATFCAAFFYIIVGRAFTWFPMSLTDTRMFAYIGSAWLRGKIPYIDIWDLKPPGIFAVNAAAFALFPQSYRALAMIEGLVLLGTAMTIYMILREWRTSTMAACLGVVVFAVSTSSEMPNMPEVYLLLPVALSMWFFTKALQKEDARCLFLAGVFTGIATIFKSTGFGVFLAQAGLVSIPWVIGSRKLSGSFVTKAILVNLVGVAFAWIPVGVYFAYHGGFWELLNASFFYPFNYASVGDRSVIRYFGMARVFLGDLAVIFVFIVLVGWVIYANYKLRSAATEGATPESADWRFYALASLWFLADLFIAFYANKSHAHYFFLVRLSTAVLCGLSLSWLFGSRSGRQTMVVRSVLFGVLIAGLMSTHAGKVLPEAVHLVRYNHLLSHDMDLGHDQPTPADELNTMAVFLNDVKVEGDTLFSWQFFPAIFAAVQMDSPVPVLDMGFVKLFSGDLKQKFGAGILAQLKQRPATFIVDGTADRAARRKESALYDEFCRLVDEQYGMRGEFKVEKANLKLYQRLREKSF